MSADHTQKTDTKVSRKEQILLNLAQMLEENPSGRITTAALAKRIGVSEAALYRHFPSKASMFEGLIVFIEETLFTRINLILDQTPQTVARCEHIMTLCVQFAQLNPGMCRLLNGDALVGEFERLHVRVAKLTNRIETQLRQILREMPLRDQQQLIYSPEAIASILLNTWSGMMNQYIRSGFKLKLTDTWKEQWPALAQILVSTPLGQSTQGMGETESAVV